MRIEFDFEPLKRLPRRTDAQAKMVFEEASEFLASVRSGCCEDIAVEACGVIAAAINLLFVECGDDAPRTLTYAMRKTMDKLRERGRI